MILFNQGLRPFYKSFNLDIMDDENKKDETMTTEGEAVDTEATPAEGVEGGETEEVAPATPEEEVAE